MAETSPGPTTTAGVHPELPWPWVATLRRLVDRHPLWADVIAALALDAVTLLPLVYNENRWWVWVLDQLLIAPLVLRRRYPFGVFTVVGAVAFAQWLLNVPLAADAALLVALYTVADHQSRARALFAAGVLEVGVVLASVRFAPPGESLVSSLILLTGMVAAALFIGMMLRARRDYLASLVERARQLETERDREAEFAATRERNRIAREMHDIIGHSLSVIISLADGARLTIDRDPNAAADAMALVSGTGRESMTEMRRLIGVLRDDGDAADHAPVPGLAQLPELADRLATIGPRVDVIVTGQPSMLPPTEDATAYRIIQESLTNVVKHAVDATAVSLLLDWQVDGLRIEILDDGAARANGHEPRNGHGLAGMSERVSLFAGQFSAGPRPEGGWRVFATLPIGGP